MSVSLPIARYAIGQRALARWANDRLRVNQREDGSSIYTFALSGSTCTNRPIEVVMTVGVDSCGRIESAHSRPASDDVWCDAMCSAAGDAQRFFRDVGDCRDAIGLSIEEAAFRDWDDEPSGCFCTAGNRRHKWRNVFQTLHYAVTMRSAQPNV